MIVRTPVAYEHERIEPVVHVCRLTEGGTDPSGKLFSLRDFAGRGPKPTGACGYGRSEAVCDAWRVGPKGWLPLRRDCSAGAVWTAGGAQ